MLIIVTVRKYFLAYFFFDLHFLEWRRLILDIFIIYEWIISVVGIFFVGFVILVTDLISRVFGFIINKSIFSKLSTSATGPCKNTHLVSGGSCRLVTLPHMVVLYT